MTRPRQSPWTAFDMLMAEVRAAPLSRMQKERFFALFRTLAGQDVYIASARMMRAERVAAAAHMLAQGEPVPMVRDRLVALYEISPRWAYRIIERARERADG